MISLAVTLASLWFLRRARQNRLAQTFAIDLTLAIFVGGFLGARLLHVFFEEPEFYRVTPLRILQIWNGGFVYLGGVAGATFAAWLFCDWKKQPFLLWADIAAPAAAFSYALGRWACFLNGCCYGKYCELPWAVFMQGGHRHPTQIYASLTESLTILILLKMESRLKKAAGALFALWLVLHGLGRIVMECFRDDPRGQLIWGFSLGTWMSLGLILCGLGLFLTRPWPKRVGP